MDYLNFKQFRNKTKNLKTRHMIIAVQLISNKANVKIKIQFPTYSDAMYL